MTPLTVAAVDDHPVVLTGLRAHLTTHAPDVVWVAAASTVDELTVAAAQVPAVVLLDLRLADGSDVASNVERLREWGAAVLLFTTEHRPAPVRRGIEAGASGLVLKGDPEDRLLEAVRSVARGEAYVSGELAHQIVNDPAGRVRLSERQLSVLGLMARGLPRRMIAAQLHVTEATLQTYRERALEAYAARGVVFDEPKELPWRAYADGHLDLDRG
ncbi:LuxR family two component transcriptional regulator [Pseudonocardia sediminis]|uniref:LuxR family two component transcriptional regulator n=1 Tax=Pseudonocardia sediminis TaxID=1397368 RepID=A0A4Q7V5Y2_PSEST|nr:response regulator transcription factor [Pseudonocardia sediminis]RZT88183.1 LuxR family two component transcriptional regulator [Pseudonocardia sediminis]